uniref:Xylanolytic transcriptional activator regulatory domain-containing protein n=1 Tax=Fusarium oxysporum (strain Fo5176) TaxID=660025 RepID=A0A0D2YEY6_FUSOF
MPTAYHVDHRHPAIYTVSSKEDSTRTEERRRVFWMAYLLDHLFGMRNDWPVTLSEHMICTKLPVPDSDFQGNCLVSGNFISQAITDPASQANSPFNDCLAIKNSNHGQCMPDDCHRRISIATEEIIRLARGLTHLHFSQVEEPFRFYQFIQLGLLCRDPVAVPNHQDPDPVQDVSDTTPETSPQVGDGESGCCNEWHQATKRNHMEDANEHISLAVYLDFTPELGPDILSHETIAHQKDGLAGRLSPESRRQIFSGIDSREEVPYIGLDEDERVSDGAGVSFDIDSVVAFRVNLMLPRRVFTGLTRMTVSDLQSDLHLRSIPVTFLDTSGKQHQVHRLVHQIPHYTFGRVIGFEDISSYLLIPNLYREEQKCRSQQFQDVTILLQAKNLNVLTKNKQKLYFTGDAA